MSLKDGERSRARRWACERRPSACCRRPTEAQWRWHAASKHLRFGGPLPGGREDGDEMCNLGQRV